MSKKKKIINAEYSMSRRIALAYIVKRPVKPWMQMIQGMFIIDFLIRTKEIRKYSQYYLHFRNLALNSAFANTNNPEKDELVSRIKTNISKWLTDQKINFPTISEGYILLVEHLTNHYKRLLQTDANNYKMMIEQAYKTWDEYNIHLTELASIEKSIDQAIKDQTDENTHQNYSRLAKHVEAYEQRKKELDEIF